MDHYTIEKKYNEEFKKEIDQEQNPLIQDQIKEDQARIAAKWDNQQFHAKYMADWDLAKASLEGQMSLDEYHQLAKVKYIHIDAAEKKSKWTKKAKYDRRNREALDVIARQSAEKKSAFYATSKLALKSMPEKDEKKEDFGAYEALQNGFAVALEHTDERKLAGFSGDRDNLGFATKQGNKVEALLNGETALKNVFHSMLFLNGKADTKTCKDLLAQWNALKELPAFRTEKNQRLLSKHANWLNQDNSVICENPQVAFTLLADCISAAFYNYNDRLYGELKEQAADGETNLNEKLMRLFNIEDVKKVNAIRAVSAKAAEYLTGQEGKLEEVVAACQRKVQQRAEDKKALKDLLRQRAKEGEEQDIKEAKEHFEESKTEKNRIAREKAELERLAREKAEQERKLMLAKNKLKARYVIEHGYDKQTESRLNMSMEDLEKLLQKDEAKTVEAWNLGTFADLAETALNIGEISDFGDFLRKAESLNTVFTQNLLVISDFVKKQEGLTFGIESIEKKLKEELLNKIKGEMKKEGSQRITEADLRKQWNIKADKKKGNEKKDKEDETLLTEMQSKLQLLVNDIAEGNEEFKLYQSRIAFVKDKYKGLFSDEDLQDMIIHARTNLITDQTLTEKQLNEIVVRDKGTLQTNKAYLKEIISNKLSAYTRDDLEKAMLKSMGGRLAVMSPAILRARANRVVSGLSVSGSEFLKIAEKEKKFQDTCKKYNIPKRYYDEVVKLHKENKRDEDALDITAESFMKQYNLNLATFLNFAKKNRFTRNDWKKIIEIRDANLTKGTRLVDDKEVSEILLELEAYQPVETQNFIANSVTYEEFIERDDKRKVTKVEEQKPGYYMGRLLGEELLDLPVFSKLDEESKALITSHFEQMILEDKNLKEAYPCLKNVTTLDQLDLLSEDEFQKMKSQMTDNLVANLYQWQSYDGAYANQVKEIMLPEIFTQVLDSEEFVAKSSRLSEKIAEENQMQQMHLNILLSSPATDHRTIEYKYLELQAEKDYLLMQGKEFKPKRRIQSATDAYRVWKMIDQTKYRERIYRFILQLNSRKEVTEDSSGNLLEGDKKLEAATEYYRKIRKESEELDKATKELLNDKDDKTLQMRMQEEEQQKFDLKNIVEQKDQAINEVTDTQSEAEKKDFAIFLAYQNVLIELAPDKQRLGELSNKISEAQKEFANEQKQLGEIEKKQKKNQASKEKLEKNVNKAVMDVAVCQQKLSQYIKFDLTENTLSEKEKKTKTALEAELASLQNVLEKCQLELTAVEKESTQLESEKTRLHNDLKDFEDVKDKKGKIVKEGKITALQDELNTSKKIIEVKEESIIGGHKKDVRKWEENEKYSKIARLLREEKLAQTTLEKTSAECETLKDAVEKKQKAYNDKRTAFETKYDIDHASFLELNDCFQKLRLEGDDHGRSKYFAEFLLGGMEDLIFSAGCEGEKSFLIYEDNVYKKEIAKYVNRISSRGLDVETILNQFKLSTEQGKIDRSLTEEQKAEFRVKLRPIIAEMRETNTEDENANKAAREYNKNTFGYESYEELKAILPQAIEETLTQPQNETTLSLKRYEKNRQTLEEYQGGGLKLVIDFLEKDPQMYKKMLNLGETAFQSELDKLWKETYAAPMNRLNGRDSFIARQFVLQHYDDIKANKLTEEEEKKSFDIPWFKYVNDYEKQLRETRVAGRNSINERSHKMHNGIYRFFKGTMYESDIDFLTIKYPDKITSLFDSESLDKELKELEETRKANNEIYKAAMKGTFGTRVAGMSKDEQEVLEDFYAYKINFESKNDFKNNFDSYEGEFKEAYQKILEHKEAVKQKEIDYKRAEKLNKAQVTRKDGRELDKKFDETMDQLRKQRYIMGSPVLAKAGGRVDNVDVKDSSVEKRKEKLDKAISGYTDEIGLHVIIDANPICRSIIEERMLAKPISPDKKEAAKLYAEQGIVLDHAYKLLKEERIGNQPLSDREIGRRLVHFYNFTKIDKGLTGDALEKALTKSSQDIVKKETSLLQFQGESKTYHKSLAAEVDDFSENMKMAAFTMESKEFDDFLKSRIAYFRVASAAYDAMDAWYKDNDSLEEKAEGKLSKSTADGFRAGLREYLHGDILKKSEPNLVETENKINIEYLKTVKEEIRKEIDQLAKDKDMVSFIYSSSNIYGGIGSDDLTEKERTGAKTLNRQSVDQYILSQEQSKWDYFCGRRNPKIVTWYAGLTQDQRKVFAIALSLPGATTAAEKLTTVSLINDDQANIEYTNKMTKDLQAFVAGEDFEPEINYAQVMGRLQKLNGEVCEELFDHAKQFTELIIAKQKAEMPKDYARLNQNVKNLESLKSISNNELLEIKKDKNQSTNVFEGRLERLKKVKKAGCTGWEAFKGQLNEMASVDSNIGNDFIYKVTNFRETPLDVMKGQEKSLVQRLTELNDVDAKKLIIILQNRSALDFSTCKEISDNIKLKSIGYADNEKRNELKDLLLKEDADHPEELKKIFSQVGSKEIQRAFETLFSYQLRDDMEHGQILKADDFDQISLGRRTFIDWALLRRAFDFLDEINEEQNKRTCVRYGRENIKESHNARAVNEYIAYVENKPFDAEAFDNRIWNNATGDRLNMEKSTALMAGFKSLNEMEKVLFIKALQHRDILDVSRNNLYLGFFGQAERDYVNPQGRDELINEFLEQSLGDKTLMQVTDEEYRNAMKSLLTTQIDDTRDFKSITEFQDMEAGTPWYEKIELETNRDTAIDWKLFERALQLVHRTMEERKMMLGEAEVYRSQGNLEKNGRYKYENEYLRKNLHNTGNRLTRFLGRQAVAAAKEFIPGASSINTVLGAVLSQSAKNAISEIKAFEEEDEENPGFLENVKEKLSQVDEYGGKAIEYKVKWKGEDDYTSAISESLETHSNLTSRVDTVGDVINTALDIYETASNMHMLKNTFAAAKKYEKEDQINQEHAKAGQTNRQIELSDQMLKQNRYMTGDVLKNLTNRSLRQDLAKELNELLVTVGTSDMLQDDVLGLSDDVKEMFGIEHMEYLINTAFSIVDFIMQFFKEKDMLKELYQPTFKEGQEMADGPFREEIVNIRDKALEEDKEHKDQNLSNSQLKELKNMNLANLAEKAYGFEGMGEHASFRALQIVHAILLGASAYNTQKAIREQSIAVLMVMGMKDKIGSISSDTHMELYSKFMGEDVR